MANYKFRLQKLLDIRKDKEEESKRVFKETQLEKEKVQQKLDKLKEEYNRYKIVKPEETLVERKLKHLYLSALNVSINETNAELQKKAEILEFRRQELKQRQIERKTVETLKEKQYEAFKKQQDLIEQNANDEFALYGFLRAREGR